MHAQSPTTLLLQQYQLVVTINSNLLSSLVHGIMQCPAEPAGTSSVCRSLLFIIINVGDMMHWTTKVMNECTTLDSTSQKIYGTGPLDIYLTSCINGAK